MWWHTRRNQISSFGAKRTIPYKSAGASVQSTTGSRGVRISGSNAGYTMYRGSVKGTGYPLHSPASPSLPVPCVTVCHHVSTGLYSPTGHIWHNTANAHCMLNNWSYRHPHRICDTYCVSTVTLVIWTRLIVMFYIHCLACYWWSVLF